MTTTNPMCIGGMYTFDGIPGVFGVTLTDTQKINLYRETVGVGVDDEVVFTEMTKIPVNMQEWFLPGDVICSNESIVEPYLDILRERVTVLFISGVCFMATPDHEFAESVRQESVEKHEWVLKRVQYKEKFDEMVVSDPYGRVVHLVLPRRTSTKFIPPMSSVFPITKKWKARHSELAPSRKRSAWLAIKKFHSLCLKSGDEMDGSKFLEFREVARHLYRYHNDVPWVPDDLQILRMRVKRRLPFKLLFWQKIRDMYEEDPHSVPRPLAAKIQRPWLAWIRVCQQDIEESYDLLDMEEWDFYRPPFRIEEIKDNGVKGSWK